MGRLPKLRLHRNGLLAVAGIVLLVALVGAVRTVAILRVITLLILVVACIELVVHRRLFNSQSTFNAVRRPRRQQ